MKMSCHTLYRFMRLIWIFLLFDEKMLMAHSRQNLFEAGRTLYASPHLVSTEHKNPKMQKTIIDIGIRSNDINDINSDINDDDDNNNNNNGYEQFEGMEKRERGKNRKKSWNYTKGWISGGGQNEMARRIKSSSSGSISSKGRSTASSPILHHGSSASGSSSSLPYHHHGSKGTISNSPIRVAFQGEPGAYSENSLRELLGPNVIAVPHPDFESCYRAVSSKEVDYCLMPVENSLGGSIHENYDLMLRYDLCIVAEHEYKVQHFVHAVSGVEGSDLKYCISHPQALAQCDGYLRSHGIKPIPMYDTSGSAKLLRDSHIANKRQREMEVDGESGSNSSPGGSNGGSGSVRSLPDQCTPENTCAIASELAGKLYDLNCLDRNVEDDETNFTRFLLLGRVGVTNFLNRHTPCKTSVVFTLPNTPGALYKALACFSLRDIDFSKIESRPTNASLLNFLKFRSQTMGHKHRSDADIPRFRYCFYLDFLANELDEKAQNALHHLREQADFCRVLGSYPIKSGLVGPIHEEIEISNRLSLNGDARGRILMGLPIHDDDDYDNNNNNNNNNNDKNGVDKKKMNIGIIGFGTFGQFLASKFLDDHEVSCIDSVDKSLEAENMGVEYFQMYEMTAFLRNLDIVVIAVPLIEFERTVSQLPRGALRKKLVVEVCPLGAHPKSVLLEHLESDVDIISSNPMFGPNDINQRLISSAWDGQPMIYEKVRITDEKRASSYLSIFERAQCQLVEMTAEQHDDCTADAEFVTHLTGQLLKHGKILPPTPIASREYAALCDVADITSTDTFDLFYGLYKFNSRAKDYLDLMRQNLAKVERQLASREAYFMAKSEIRNNDRERLISECKQLLKDIAIMDRTNNNNNTSNAINTNQETSSIIKNKPAFITTNKLPSPKINDNDNHPPITTAKAVHSDKDAFVNAPKITTSKTN